LISTENWTGCHFWHNQFLSDTLHKRTLHHIYIYVVLEKIHKWHTDVDVMGWKPKINHYKNNASFCQEFLPRPQTQCKAYMHLARLNERIGVALTGYSAS